MKVIELKSENFKKIKAVNITPKDDVVMISGANGQGKTSLIDSIFAALSGRKIPKKPIRKGENKAEIELNLGTYIVKRVITEKSNYLTVTNSEGASFKSPQSMLDNMLGELSFDPLDFAKMDQDKQKKILLKLVGLSEKLDILEKRKNEYYSERSITNKELKNLKGQLEEIEKIDNPPTEVSIVELTTKLKEANKILSANNELRYHLTEASNNVKIKQEKVLELKNLLSTAERNLEAAKKDEIRIQNEIKQIKDPNVAILEIQLSKAEENNNLARQANLYNTKEKEILSKQEEADNLSRQIEEIDKQKSIALNNTKFPIDGLSFSDVGVTYKEIPFEQISSAERLKVSLAIAMALNPTIRIIRVSDGSLLDKNNLKIINELAKENDYQIWIEKVDESGKIGFYIEEGSLIK